MARRLPRGPHDLKYVGVHVTGADIAADGSSTKPEQIVDVLAGLSVYDCIRMVGRLSVILHLGASRFSPQAQQALIDRAITPVAPELGRRLSALLTHGQIPFFEQQLYHAARLSILHADLREPDDFARGGGFGDFLFCLFGLTDSFADLDDPSDDDAVLSWALRQASMNHNVERLTLWSFYFELFNRIWPELGETRDPEDAFRRYTGLSIHEYLALGFAFSAGFGHQVGDGPPQAEVDPAQWFSSAKVDERQWRSFLGVAGRSVEDLRGALATEVESYGESSYLSLEMEKTPILLGPRGRAYVLNLPALERRATHGIFHILAEGASAEGLDREHYTSPFGAAFQAWAEQCIRRAEEVKADPPQIFADVRYGPKKDRRDTPDIVLRYRRQLVTVEMVSGPLRIKTVTHGDLESFEADLQKLVLKKAGQLARRIGEIDDGLARDIGLDAEGVVRIWPVIVTVASFPILPMIMKTIRKRLKDEGLLQGKRIAPISIITAEELAALEGELLRTETPFVSLLTEWKAHERTGDHSLKNFLVERAAERGEAPPAAEHHREMFAAASSEMFKRLFGHPGPPVSEEGPTRPPC